MIKYFMRPDSNTPPAYIYIEGDETDSLWDSKTCTEVPKKPSSNHLYNMQSKKWYLSEAHYMTHLRNDRDNLLLETDKYMISDYPISEEDKALMITYRKDLRDCPSKTILAERILPSFPDLNKG